MFGRRTRCRRVSTHEGHPTAAATSGNFRRLFILVAPLRVLIDDVFVTTLRVNFEDLLCMIVQETVVYSSEATSPVRRRLSFGDLLHSFFELAFYPVDG